MSAIIAFLILQSELFEPYNILKFADHLYLQKDYVGALNEYRRYLFLTESLSEDISEKIIDCLIKLNRYDEAIKESARLEDDTKKDFAKGWIYYLMGEHDSSRIHLSGVGQPYKEDAEKIIGLGYAFEFKFNEAGKYIKLPDTHPKYKKPLLGALCALFPGGGHFYCNRTGDGVFSFLVVSASALLAHYYYEQKEDVKFGISLGTALLFYLGSIYGGINAVQNYNYYQNETYLQEILESTE